MNTIGTIPGRILLVGDGRDHIRSCREILIQNGHEVYSAVDADQALSIVESWVPDLVLILYVSENDGCAALEKMLFSPVIGSTRVFLGCDTTEKIPGCSSTAGAVERVFPQTVEGLARDVSGLKRMEQVEILLRSQVRRAKRMEVLGILAGGIAHDFNNILTPVLLHAEMGLGEVSEDSPLQIHLQEIVKASKRARDLVKQILGFSRRPEEKRISLQLSVLVKETLKLLRAAFPATIEISHRIDDSGHWINADPVQMNQVLLTLGTNAFQAMHEHGGLLDVRLEVVGLTRGEGDAWPELEPGTFLCLTFRYTGRGSEKYIPKQVGEPFFIEKIDEDDTGLTHVHEIVRSHQGMIKVENVPGDGAFVTVFLPVTHSEDKSVALETHTSRGSEIILYVDDEAPMRNSMTSLLKHLGYRVETCESGKSALDLFSTDPVGFDLVITDHTMPGMTGLELSQALLQIRPDLLVILCTGFSEEVTDEKVLALGIKRLLLKPFGLQELSVIIRDVLGKG